LRTHLLCRTQTSIAGLYLVHVRGEAMLPHWIRRWKFWFIWRSMEPHLRKTSHLISAGPCRDIFKHVHVCNLEHLNQVHIQGRRLRVMKIFLNPMHKQTATKQVRNFKLKNLLKEDVMKSDNIW
jgi:hypothetical protein